MPYNWLSNYYSQIDYFTWQINNRSKYCVIIYSYYAFSIVLHMKTKIGSQDHSWTESTEATVIILERSNSVYGIRWPINYFQNAEVKNNCWYKHVHYLNPSIIQQQYSFVTQYSLCTPGFQKICDHDWWNHVWVQNKWLSTPTYHFLRLCESNSNIISKTKCGTSCYFPFFLLSSGKTMNKYVSFLLSVPCT